jgi:hypothetical protein
VLLSIYGCITGGCKWCWSLLSQKVRRQMINTIKMASHFKNLYSLNVDFQWPWDNECTVAGPPTALDFSLRSIFMSPYRICNNIKRTFLSSILVIWHLFMLVITSHELSWKKSQWNMEGEYLHCLNWYQGLYMLSPLLSTFLVKYSCYFMEPLWKNEKANTVSELLL